MTVRNRIVLAPMLTFSAAADGTITAEELQFLRRRSRGVGMALSGACFVASHGHAHTGQWSCTNDAAIPNLRTAAEAIKSGGALAILQIHHGGRMCRQELLGHAPLGPSDVACPKPGYDTPRPMTEAEIEETIKAFGQAARRAIAAGFDGVEIHGANGYLLQQFFSPHSNRRTDQWGGSLENRAAFPIAVLEEVQEVVRRNAYRPFSIGYRLSPEEAVTPGITLDDTLQLVEGLVACRPDWLHVSADDYFGGSVRDDDDRPRAKIIAQRVRGRVSVIAAGSIVTPDAARHVLSDGPNMVALGRALIMDPEWMAKVTEGREHDIVPCLPATGACETLDIPHGMYRTIVGRPGWLPICPEGSVDHEPRTQPERQPLGL